MITPDRVEGTDASGGGREDDDMLSALAATVLAEEQRRHAAQAANVASVDVGELSASLAGEEMQLGAVLKAGGALMLTTLFLVNLLDEFDRAAFAVLGADIQKSLSLSDTQLGLVAAIGGLVAFVGAIPLGYLADRGKRTRLLFVCMSMWAVFATLTSAVQSVLHLVLARIGTGLGKASDGPVQRSMLSDTYPLGGRTRVFAVHYLASPIGAALGPLIAGVTAALVGGEYGWRWAFVVIALPAVGVLFLVARLKEPARGQNEQMAVLGAATEADDTELPIKVGAAFAALKKIKTYYWFMAGLGVLGFAIVSAPIYINLILEDRFGLGPAGRGGLAAISGVGSIGGLLIGGRTGERFMRESPERAARLAGLGLATLGITMPLSVFMPNIALYSVVAAFGSFSVSLAIIPAMSMVAAVTPYRLRSMGFALSGVYLSLIGGVGGAVLVGGLSDAYGQQVAILLVVPPAAFLGGGLIRHGGRFVCDDLANVALEIREERLERERVASGEQFPVLQVRHLDFSYGRVQVLFDVELDLWPGEVLALLGTNGAGKSTLLKAISGLGVPDRGTVRLNGRAVTYAAPSDRVRLGLVQMSGGKAIFPEMSVADNLRAGTYTLSAYPDVARERLSRAYDLFPMLGARPDQLAGSLSGGQQQMLAMAKALLTDPEVLLIDELSLGLSPIMTEQLLGVVEQLKADGLSVVLVEQSINVALTVADRALFMEKGRIRFEGEPSELLERDDLARAVFLGGD